MMRRFRKNEDGAVAIVFAFALVPLVLVTGAALDYSRATKEKTNMAGALDAALIAAALAKPDQREATARATYAANASGDRTDRSVTFWENTTTNTYHGRVESDVPTTLMAIARIDSVAVKAEAAVSLGNNPVCMLLTAPSGKALNMGSSSQIKMPGCEVHVKSTSSLAAVLNSSAVVDSNELCVAGGIDASLNKDSYHEACRTADDRWAEKMPVMSADPSCAYNNKTYNNNNAPSMLYPGNICNGMTFNSSVTVTFAPGLYRVRGGPIHFKAASRIIAEGVTFYFEDAKSYLSMNANSQMTITPPTSGTYQGIAMFEPPGLLPSDMEFVSAASAVTNGLFYLPSRNLTLNSSSGFSARRMNVVAYTATFASSSTWVVEPVPEEELRVYDTEVRLTM